MPDHPVADVGNKENTKEANNENTREQLARLSDLVSDSEKTLFDEAPVMMHSIDENGFLVHVNHRWQDTLGYQADEVLGRKSTEFLTEESRTQAIAATLPLFWEVGRSNSIGYCFVRKNGRVIELLLDAVACDDLRGGRVTLATLRKSDDLVQWQQAALTIQALQGLRFAHQGLARLLSEDGEAGPSAFDEQSQHLDEAPKEDTPKEGMPMLPWELVSVTRDILLNLLNLVDLEEAHVKEIQNNRQILTLMADTIEMTLSKMTSDTE